MSKLFVSDIDGTLLPRGQKLLSEKNVEMLKRLIDAGVVTAVASGRSYDSVVSVFPGEILPQGLYVISNDGALCTFNGKPLYHKPFSSESLEKFFKTVKLCGAGFFCRSGDSLIYGESDIFECCEAFAEAKGKRVCGIGRFENVYKIGVIDENGVFDDGITVPCDARCAYDDGFLREYVCKYADKANAVADLQARTFSHREDTFICGDGENDVCMISKAKYSASVGNCCGEMLKKCSLHFESGEEALEYCVSLFLTK